jgi:hypothetical protein
MLYSRRAGCLCCQHASEPTTDAAAAHSTITSTWSCAPCSSISPSNAISCIRHPPTHNIPRDEPPTSQGAGCSHSTACAQRSVQERRGGGKGCVTHLALLRRAQRAHQRLEDVCAPLVGEQDAELHLRCGVRRGSVAGYDQSSRVGRVRVPHEPRPGGASGTASGTYHHLPLGVRSAQSLDLCDLSQHLETLNARAESTSNHSQPTSTSVGREMIRMLVVTSWATSSSTLSPIVRCGNEATACNQNGPRVTQGCATPTPSHCILACLPAISPPESKRAQACETEYRDSGKPRVLQGAGGREALLPASRTPWEV